MKPRSDLVTPPLNIFVRWGDLSREKLRKLCSFVVEMLEPFAKFSPLSHICARPVHFFFFCEDWYTKRCDRLIRLFLESSHNSLSKFGSCLTRYFKIGVLADRCVSTFSFCDHIIRLSIHVCHGRMLWHLDYSWYSYSLFATLWPSRDEKDELVSVTSLNWHALRLWTLLNPFSSQE